MRRDRSEVHGHDSCLGHDTLDTSELSSSPCPRQMELSAEEIMNLPTYSSDDLKKLPLRAIAAFAARCARRVEQRALLPDHHPEAEDCRRVVGDAIRLVEDFARGLPCTSAESVVREAERVREAAQGDVARQDAIAAIVQAAHAAVTAREATEVRSIPARGICLAPPPYPLPRPVSATSRRISPRSTRTRRRSTRPMRPGTPKRSSRAWSGTTRH